MVSNKIYIPDFTLNELIDFIKSIGEKAYRGRQIFEWVHQHRVKSFTDMTNIPIELQDKLADIADITRLTVSKDLLSEDGTRKFLFTLQDGHFIETVYIPEEKRRTLCISSQVGCSLKCTFCATGLMGFYRNLSAGEIVDQLLTVTRTIGEKVTNVVFMGMGEPFLNYDNVLKAADSIHNQYGYKLGTRHITISTAGLADRIAQFLYEGRNYKLALSLNAGTQTVRQSLMPIAQKYPLSRLKNVFTQMVNSYPHPITLEYVLLKDINDSDYEIKELIAFAKPLRVKINLIPYNIINAHYQATSDNRIKEIYKIISNAGIHTNIRKSSGGDIKAACGQLFSEQKKRR